MFDVGLHIRLSFITLKYIALHVGCGIQNQFTYFISYFMDYVVKLTSDESLLT